MKRLLVLLSVFIFLLFASFTFIHSQEFDFNRAYKDYLYNYDLYRKSHLNYMAAKSEYLTYKTLSSQTKALEATKAMLLTRATALETYLVALRMRLREATGITNYQQNLYYIKLDEETTWINNHKQVIPTAGSLEDLFKTSSEFEVRFSSSTFFSFQVRGIIFGGRILLLREKVKSQVTTVEQRIDEMRKAGLEVAVLERWMIQAKDKNSRAEEKFNAAENTLASMKNEKNVENVYNNAIGLYEESAQYLKETLTLLKEIIQEIKRV